MSTLITLFPKFLHEVWFTNFSVNYAINYGECVRHLGERIGISPLTSKRVQPRKDSTVCHPSVFV